MSRSCAPSPDPLRDLLLRAARLADDPVVRRWLLRLARRGEGGQVPPALREGAREGTTTTRPDAPPGQA